MPFSLLLVLLPTQPPCVDLVLALSTVQAFAPITFAALRGSLTFTKLLVSTFVMSSLAHVCSLCYFLLEILFGDIF